MTVARRAPGKGEVMEKKILIVDDEAHIRLLLEQTFEEFEDEGVEILMAENGREALEVIEEERPDMVFLDVMMPELSGFEVCSSVKGNDDLKGTYVVLLTAKGQELDKKKGIEVGADLYMTKPFDPDEVFSKARQVLGL